ncbi:hypothetical protein A7D17_14170 [Xanthomonas floridensis]|uniref:Uncharacterized protein n=1 Tax=Xanthomonas floridensis TaxID=1843580 RepID=A0A1A9MEZ7_9XANT|nr:hypothetical protein A7D17_14170 [Xanthomonas floridensis]
MIARLAIADPGRSRSGVAARCEVAAAVVASAALVRGAVQVRSLQRFAAINCAGASQRMGEVTAMVPGTAFQSRLATCR